MKHKYNIPGILASIIGYRGVPFPGAFFPKRPEGDPLAQEYDLTPEAPARKETIKGTRLYGTDHLGRPYFMPVSFKHKDIPDGGIYELPDAVLTITGKKNIVETALVGRKGTVKELISTDDYKISIAAFIQGSDHTYPDAQVEIIRDLYKIDETVELISAFTDLLFDAGDKVAITDISFPPLPGVEDAVAVKIECVTDKPFELTM